MANEGFKLPMWNDLTNEQRRIICGQAALWSYDEYLDGDAAHAIYNTIRDVLLSAE